MMDGSGGVYEDSIISSIFNLLCPNWSQIQIKCDGSHAEHCLHWDLEYRYRSVSYRKLTMYLMYASRMAILAKQNSKTTRHADDCATQFPLHANERPFHSKKPTKNIKHNQFYKKCFGTNIYIFYLCVTKMTSTPSNWNEHFIPFIKHTRSERIWKSITMADLQKHKQLIRVPWESFLVDF